MPCEPVVIEGDCSKILEDTSLSKRIPFPFHLTFLDPPFNQNKIYDGHNDNMEEKIYWDWIFKISKYVFVNTIEGGAIYFMQREKNLKYVLNTLENTGWVIQNIIIWKKKTSAVPQRYRYGKQYQIIAYAIKGQKARVFNKLRIDLPLGINQRVPRKSGVYVTDVWDDIRELTSGFFAGDEALRDFNTSKRLHEQQTPISLLFRIILSSTNVGDTILDPFAGTGTTSVVAMQLNRNSIAIEKSKSNCDILNNRIKLLRKADKISELLRYYRFTENLNELVGFNQQLARFIKKE